MSILRYLLTFLLLFIVTPAAAEDNDIFFRDNFDDLENWKIMDFPTIKKHSIYSIERQGDGSYLKAESSASASGIVFNKTFNVFDYPKVKWRWKVSNVYEKGDVTKRAGDDYPARIIFMFKYSPEGSSIGKRLKYEIVKGIYGFYPPQSTLIYVWANKKYERGIFTSTYAPEEKIIIMEQGPEKTGKWIEEVVNVLEDYHRAFGTDPPPEAGIAVMNDSDDTGEKAVSFFDYIEIYR
jgi:hypothetical protein